MNIIEAIKSGRRFRHKLWRGYDDNDWADPVEVMSDIMVKLTMPVGALIADDWEVEQTSVTITRDDFDAAWRRALDVSENMQITTQHYLYELVVRELGL